MTAPPPPPKDPADGPTPIPTLTTSTVHESWWRRVLAWLWTRWP